MTEPEPEAAADVSGALAWARNCLAGNTEMRAWVDLDAITEQPMLWTASLLLLHHLEANSTVDDWDGRRILELGSGAGHLAVGMARLGAHVVATESGECGTFEPMRASTQHLLAERAGGGEPSSSGSCAGHGESAALSAGSSSGTVAFRKLHWGLDDLPPAEWKGFDVILLSELTFEPDLHEALLGVLRHVLMPGMVAYSIFVDRPFSLNFMIMLDDDGSFDTEEIEMANMLELEDDLVVYAHVIRRKADVQDAKGGA